MARLSGCHPFCYKFSLKSHEKFDNYQGGIELPGTIRLIISSLLLLLAFTTYSQGWQQWIEFTSPDPEPPIIQLILSDNSNVEFDVDEEYRISRKKGERPKAVLERSLAQHSEMCIENSADIMDARSLANLLSDQIAYRIRLYSYSIY